MGIDQTLGALNRIKNRGFVIGIAGFGALRFWNMSLKEFNDTRGHATIPQAEQNAALSATAKTLAIIEPAQTRPLSKRNQKGRARWGAADPGRFSGLKMKEAATEAAYLSWVGQRVCTQ